MLQGEVTQDAIQDTIQDPIKVEFDNFEHGFPAGFGPRGWSVLAYGVAIAFAVFQLYVAAFNYLPSQVVRGIHVGFLILLTFGLIGNFTAKGNAGRAACWLIGAAGFLCGLYQWIFYADLIARDGDPTRLDLAVGTLLAVLIFDGTRRLMGPALPLMCGACLVYWFFGQYLPSPLNHRGYDFDQVISHLAYGTEGFYGVPIYVSATYIFLFILFGSFLERAGMIQLFTDVSLGLFGGTRGGPAKVAVFASGMMGTISGSGVANVVTVGQFTIPLMIRFGYRRAFAAGVEATASMGGQIMPPVMGAVAFIMAETLGVEYAVVVKAAVIPAILYFASAFWMVHLEAGKHGLVGMKRSEIPSATKALIERWYLVLPLAALVYMLFEGFTPLYAGSMGLALTVALILGASIMLGFSNTDPALCVLDRPRAGCRGGVASRARDPAGGRDRRGHDCDCRDHPRWPRHLARLPGFAGRQRQVGADRRHGLRHRRRDHRHDVADRCRHRVRRLDHRPR